MEKPSLGIWKRNKAARGKHEGVLKFQLKLLDNVDKDLPLLNRNSAAGEKNVYIFQCKLKKQRWELLFNIEYYSDAIMSSPHLHSTSEHRSICKT